MKLDTSQCEQIANAIAALKGSQSFPDASLQQRHEQIQAKLSSLESFFRKLAQLVEENENSLANVPPIEISTTSGLSYSGSTTGSWAALATGKSIGATLSANYSLGSSQSAWVSENAQATTNVGALEGSVQGKASIQILKDKKFNPELDLEVNAKGHLVAGQLEAGVKQGIFGASASAQGEIGAVYGTAKATFSVNEQVLKAQVGAAAARGQCSLAFELAGLKVTIGLSGSFGGVEAGFEYSNRVGQWQMGVNGALFAGGGLKIQVDY